MVWLPLDGCAPPCPLRARSFEKARKGWLIESLQNVLRQPLAFHADGGWEQVAPGWKRGGSETVVLKVPLFSFPKPSMFALLRLISPILALGGRWGIVALVSA